MSTPAYRFISPPQHGFTLAEGLLIGDRYATARSEAEIGVVIVTWISMVEFEPLPVFEVVSRALEGASRPQDSEPLRVLVERFDDLDSALAGLERLHFEPYVPAD